MPTYAENAATAERAARNQRQDTFLGAQQSDFDADVKANTDKRGGWKRLKYERASFTVVTASPAYRAGYAQITWGGHEPEAVGVESVDQPGPTG